MQVNYFGNDKFEVKASKIKIIFQKGVDIEDFKITGPGEYERRGVFVEGIGKDSKRVIFIISCQGVKFCYPVNLNRVPNDEEIKRIGDIDILFIPLGEEGTLELKKASELVSKVDPRVVIPMLYDDIEKFKKSEGVSDGETDEFKFNKVDLPSEERKIVILKPQK